MLNFFNSIDCFLDITFESKIIVFAWVNDEDSKRVHGIKTDAYRVFKKMLENHYPPNDWNALLKEAEAESNRSDKSYEKLE